MSCLRRKATHRLAGTQTERIILEDEARCLCGKTMGFCNDGTPRLHRANQDSGKPRRVRKQEWCQIPVILMKAKEKGNLEVS